MHRTAWQGAYAGIIPHRALTAMINRRGADWWANAIRRAATVLVVEIGGKIAGYATLGTQPRPRARRSKARSTSSICARNIRASGWAAGCSPRRAPGSQSHGLNGMVVWALEENQNALAFYTGAGGRDVAEGVEVFDQKAIRKVAFVWE